VLASAGAARGAFTFCVLHWSRAVGRGWLHCRTFSLGGRRCTRAPTVIHFALVIARQLAVLGWNSNCHGSARCSYGLSSNAFNSMAKLSMASLVVPLALITAFCSGVGKDLRADPPKPQKY
jgi:hypothetical protein